MIQKYNINRLISEGNKSSQEKKSNRYSMKW